MLFKKRQRNYEKHVTHQEKTITQISVLFLKILHNNIKFLKRKMSYQPIHLRGNLSVQPTNVIM